MSTFVEEVATALYKKYGDEVSSLTILLPSKRARLFFAESLSALATKPIWEPTYSSIDELMCNLSGLRRADKIRLITELHHIYSKYHKEEFDTFYYWGEMLISDFDMIDKYDIDASQLFSNIYDLKELESDDSYLTEEQRSILNRFWATLANKHGKITDSTPTRKAFLDIWRSLNTIYEEFRNRLRSLQLGYSGMIYRDAIERLERGEAEADLSQRYIFVGFNALSKCEQRLMKYLAEQGVAEFYWDKDDYYASDRNPQEAGMFIRENDCGVLRGEEGISHDNLRNIGSIEVVSAVSNVAQCQYVVDILKKIAAQSKDGKLSKDTAIVLTDENLLMPLLYALPESMKVERYTDKNGVEREKPAINVTMGYPLRSTLAYSLIERLLDLQKHAHQNTNGDTTFYHADVDGLLSHPYIADDNAKQYTSIREHIVKHKLYQVGTDILHTTPLLQCIFRKPSGWRDLYKYILEVIDIVSTLNIDGEESAFRSEFLATIYDSVVKLANVVDSCGEVKGFTDDIARSLLRRHLQAERIPFTGEPLEGLQVMGILETRNIDFRNVIILSMTDSNFPGNRSADHSFIPYALRYGFELPTAEHHEGVYAYYFYRLISRAENLYMLYSSQADDKSSGEPSRYIRQLEYESNFPIQHKSVSIDVKFTDQSMREVVKEGRILEELQKLLNEGTISPTAFSTYVKCPMQFYYKYIEHLRIDEELEDNIDALTFGNIFHHAAELVYQDLKNQQPIGELLKRKLKKVDEYVDQAISQIYFKRKDGVLPELSSEMQIIRNIIRSYLGKNVMAYDIKHSDFCVMHTERVIDCEFDFDIEGKTHTVKFEGKSDRIDSLDSGAIRVIDYKTGKPDSKYTSIHNLFHSNRVIERNDKIINTLLYSMMLSHNTGRDVVPELYFVGAMSREEFSPSLIANKEPLTSYSECCTEFEEEVEATLSELFNPKIPFRHCVDDGNCSYCDYATLCKGKHKN